MKAVELAMKRPGGQSRFNVLTVSLGIVVLALNSSLALADKGPGGGSGSSRSSGGSGKNPGGVVLFVPVITISAITPLIPVIPVVSTSNSGSNVASTNLRFTGMISSANNADNSSANPMNLVASGDGISERVRSGNIPATNILILPSQRDSSGQGNGDSGKTVVSVNGNDVSLRQGRTIELVDPASSQLRVEITAPEGQDLKIGSIITDSARSGIYAGLSTRTGAMRTDRAVIAPDGRIMLQAMRPDAEFSGARTVRENEGPGRGRASGSQHRLGRNEGNDRTGQGTSNRDVERDNRHGSGRDDSQRVAGGTTQEASETAEGSEQGPKAASSKSGVCS